MSLSDSQVKLHRFLHRGALKALLVSIMGAALGLAAHAFISRLIGQVGYGTYALMLSWVSVLSVVAQAGQDLNVVRFLPTYVLRGEWGKARGLRRGIGCFVFGISVVVALACCAVVAIVGRHQSQSWRATFYIGFAMLPILTQLQQSGAMHRAFKRAASANAYWMIARSLALIVIIAVFAVTLHRVDAPLAALATVMSTMVALMMSACHMSWAWPTGSRKTRPQYDMGNWLRVGMRLSVLSWVIVGASRSDVLILGALAGSADVGPYFAAVQLAGLVYYAFQAVNVILAPMIAERYDAGDLQGMETVVRRGARLGFLGGIVAAGFLAGVGYWVLGLFGPSFTSAYVPLLILLVGYCAVTAIGPGGFVLSMTKYQNQSSLFAATGLVVNVVLALVLIPRIGVLGAALANAVQLIVWHWLTLRFVVSRVGINSSGFGHSCVDGAVA